MINLAMDIGDSVLIKVAMKINSRIQDPKRLTV